MHVAGLIGATWGMAGRQWVRNLPPTRLVSLFGTIAEQSILRFSGKKKVPGFQVSGPVSIVIWKLLSLAGQSRAVRFKGYRPPPPGRGASWEMEFYLEISSPCFRC